MQRQAQGYDVSAMFTEFQGRSIPGQGVEIHAEKIHREFTVDVMEFIFIFPVVFFPVCLVDFLQVMQIVRAFGIDALM